MNENTITCPKCQHKFSIDELQSHEIAEKIKKELSAEYKQRWLEEKGKLDKKEQELKKQIQEEQGLELTALQERLAKQQEELEKSKQFELELRKKTQELEDKEKNMELNNQRQLDAERAKIREKTEEEVMERLHLKEREKDQIIESLRKSLEEAQRKATQGSQQLQGEILELELEETLRREFPIDEIGEVSKGVRGADAIHIVKDHIGREVGKIIWESKRTKAFDKDWIDKLKEDMRNAKADIAIIVSTTLPPDVRFFAHRNGVYLTSFECMVQVAFVLRKSLLDLANTKALSVGKNEKIESLYRYITSSEFAQKIDSMMETYQGMSQTLEKEKTALQKIWAQREKEIDRLKTNTLTIHGSLSGLIEEGMAEVKSLDFPEVDLSDEELSV